LSRNNTARDLIFPGNIIVTGIPISVNWFTVPFTPSRSLGTSRVDRVAVRCPWLETVDTRQENRVRVGQFSLMGIWPSGRRLLDPCRSARRGPAGVVLIHLTMADFARYSAARWN